MLQALSLSELAGIRHSFFTRNGGVSQGVYASLNGGVGSNDAPEHVAENRARMAAALGVKPDRLHHRLSNPFARRGRRRQAVDAKRTPARRRHRHAHGRGSPSACRPPTAGRCCSPTARRGVIGAAHAGWRGALTGVIEATRRGHGKTRRRNARASLAALGPTISQPNYEVGPEFVERFLAADADQCAFLCALASAPATPCSTYRLHRRSHSPRRHCEFRGSRPVQLRRARTLFQLPPHYQAQRAGLRPPYQRHRAHRLTACRGQTPLG